MSEVNVKNKDESIGKKIRKTKQMVDTEMIRQAIAQAVVDEAKVRILAINGAEKKHKCHAEWYIRGH